MITIKYVWLYAAIFLAGVGGYGANHALSSDADLASELIAAKIQIEKLKEQCPAHVMKRVPLKHSRGEEF